jgi:L-asparaginase
MTLPKILILYTGGTIGMDLQINSKKGEVTVAVPQLSAQMLTKKLRQRLPELTRIAQCDVDVLMNRDSAHIGPDEWILLANHIQRKWRNYDGVVLLHGTDTLAYTSSALSLLLRPCIKPIVITGAQRPLSALRTDARMNLISAVEIAAHGPRKQVNQVCVFFDNKLFQGNRVRKESASDFAAFKSPYCPPLAVVGTTIRYSDSRISQDQPKTPPLTRRFSNKVVVIHLTPGFPADCMSDEFLSQVDGIILVVFLSGTAPTHLDSFLFFLSRIKGRKVPVVLVTEGGTLLPGSSGSALHYAAGKELRSAGCFWAGTMTLECAFVKTSLILGQNRDLKQFSTLWRKNFANEGDF